MTQPTDAAGMAETIARLGLAEHHVVLDLLEELDNKKGPAEPLVRLMERRGILTPFQGAKLLKGETDGYFLGGYRLLYRIASGSFGKVYRGDDPKTGQIVAVKVLRKKWLEGEGRAHRITQFEREGRNGLTLQHPNIVSILAVSKDAATDSYFIVMEFIEGGNLRDILTIRKKLPVPEALRIMEECAAGLTHAYEQKLTHRDIKPTNILISTDGVAKLVDFGLAEVTQQGPTPVNAIVLQSRTKAKSKQKEKEEEAADRTLDYAGLEKATNVKSGDIRSDIYFLGHALFEMIAGEPLMARTKDRRMALEPRRFEQVEGTFAKLADQHGLAPSLRSLIGKAIALEPHRRFQTPEQFLDAIRTARAEFPLPARDQAAPAPGQPKAAAPVPPKAPLPVASPSPAPPAAPKAVSGPRTIFVVEPHDKLRGIFQDQLVKMGFDVLTERDPQKALPAYRKKPYHAIIVDGGVTGSEGTAAFDSVLAEAKKDGSEIAGILILNDGQKEASLLLAADSRTAVLVRPVTMKQLADKLAELVPA